MTDLLSRYADLIVRVGANVQPGQQVFVVGLVEHADRSSAQSPRPRYGVGARNVDVRYVDQHVRRSFILHAPEEDLLTDDAVGAARAVEALLEGGGDHSVRRRA